MLCDRVWKSDSIWVLPHGISKLKYSSLNKRGSLSSNIYQYSKHFLFITWFVMNVGTLNFFLLP
jgi:hypothetical protein